MSWRNDDGMLVKFGTEKAEATYGGELSTMGGKKFVEFDIDLVDASLSSTDAQVDRTDTVWMPSGALIEKVIVTVTEAVTSGDAANLDLGLAYYLHAPANTLTELDYDGLLVAADGFVAGAIGEVHEYTQGSTDHGALIGTILAATAETGYPNHDRYIFTASEDTGSFTAGSLHVRVEFVFPNLVGA